MHQGTLGLQRSHRVVWKQSDPFFPQEPSALGAGAGCGGGAATGAHGGEEQELEIRKETRPENAADSLQKDDPSSFDMDMFPRKDTALEKLFISVRR